MKFQAVKGTRDFYPEQMRLRNWISDAWRRVSLRHGFEEYDSPIFEYLDLFTVKSGDEIASQLFSFADRGGRNLAIRAETTPSLARMINARINTLPRPIKWFSVSRVCRAENPQKGRLREFFQWNVDVVGSDDVLADAECIFVAADFLREVGLTPSDVLVHIGSRPLTTAMLTAIGVPAERHAAVLPVLDKRPKVTVEEFIRLCKQAHLSDEQVAAVRRFQDCTSFEQLCQTLPAGTPGAAEHLENLRRLLAALDELGAAPYCRLDMRMVRGLAYYTGVVYEIFDTAESLRAVGGGGRYDNLLEVLGGPAMGATGFGMGDVVLGILLEGKAKLPSLAGGVDYFVVTAGEDCRAAAMQATGALRRAGASAEISYREAALGKQLKEANRRRAKYAVIVAADTVGVKDLSSGAQTDIPLSQFLANPLAVPTRETD